MLDLEEEDGLDDRSDSCFSTDKHALRRQLDWFFNRSTPRPPHEYISLT